MRTKTLSNWLADFQKILVGCIPYFQEIWQLLCCWSDYVWLYLVDFSCRSELQISQLLVLKTFMWSWFFVSFALWRVFSNASPSLCRSICVDGYLRSLRLKFCLWRAVYFLSTKGVTFLRNPQELWNHFNSLSLTFAPVRENKISFFAGNIFWNVDERKRITTSNFIIKLFIESKPPNIVK